jgi:hypothetical protein
MMKRFLLVLALSLISVVTLNAQQVVSQDPSDRSTGKLSEPSALVLVMAGIGGLTLWTRRRR